MLDVFRHNWRRNSREFLHFPAKGKICRGHLPLWSKNRIMYQVLCLKIRIVNFGEMEKPQWQKQKKTNYGNESISSLKGADRVRKRPGVIFGSDGLDGCEHAVFEILSNSIDEAREGHGKLITVTRYLDHSIEVEDMGRGCPVDYNPKEKRFNWELVYCELYAAASTTTWTATTTNTPSASTASARARRSIPRATWT